MHLSALPEVVAGCKEVPQVATWKKLCEEGELPEAIDALDLRVRRGSYVNKSLFFTVLRRCTAKKDLVVGSRAHVLATKKGYDTSAYLANQIICMYAAHGRLEEATQAFNKVSAPNRHMWASIIFAYARHGQPKKAIVLYREMRQSAVKPHDHIFVAALKACAFAEDLSAGRDVHADILVTTDNPSMFVGTGLVDMYAKCGCLEDARKVFDNLPTRDVVTWTAMIAGYAQHGRGQEALSLYASMQQEGITPANHVTFVCLLQACASVRDLQQGKQLHVQIQQRGLETHAVVATSLVDMYAKCGSLEDARQVFDELPRKNVVTWNAMIAGYARHGLGEESLALYGCMQTEGITPADAVTFVYLLQACGIVAGLDKGKEIHAQISKTGLDATDLFVASTLIDMYGKCGSMFDAQQVFDALPKRDSVTYSALIAGYSRQGGSELVFDLYDRMTTEGIQPDGITFISLLTVCRHVGLVDKGLQYFEAMSKDFGITPTAEHFKCLLDLLGRAGKVNKAMEMVQIMPFQPDSEMWRIVLGACQKWNSVEIGRQAFECAMKLDKTDVGAYVLMSNIYEDAHMHDEAEEIQALRVKVRAEKKPGQTRFTDATGNVHTFVVGDNEHLESQVVYARLGYLLMKGQKEGYLPQS